MKLFTKTSIFDQPGSIHQTPKQPENQRTNASLYRSTADAFIRQQPSTAVHFTGKHGPKVSDEQLFQQFPTSFQPIFKAAANKSIEAGSQRLNAEHLVWAAIHTLDNLAGWNDVASRGSRQANKEREKQAALLAKALMPNHPNLTPQQVAETLRPLAQELEIQFKDAMQMDEPANLEIQRALKQAMQTAIKAEEQGVEPAPQALLRRILWQVPPVPSFTNVASSARSLAQALEAPATSSDDNMSSADEDSIKAELDPNNWEDFGNALQEKAPAVARWVKSSGKHLNGPLFNDVKLAPLSHIVATGVEVANRELTSSQRRRNNGQNNNGQQDQPFKRSLNALIPDTKGALSVDRTFLGGILERSRKNLMALNVPHNAAEAQEQSRRTRQVLENFISQPGRADFSLEGFVEFLRDTETATQPGVPAEHAAIGRILNQLHEEASDTRIPQMEQFEKSAAALMKHGTNMVRQGMEHQIPSVLLRREATDRMLAMLATGGDRSNILLNAGSGEGKTYAVRGLAQRFADNDVPENMKGTQMVQLNVGSLTGGTPFRGDLEDRLQDVFKQLNKYLTDNPKRKVVLFVDEIHMIGEMLDSMKASGILEKKNLSFIGATTPEDWRKSALRNDGAFQGRFHELALPSFNQSEKLAILGHAGTKMGKKNGVSIPPELLEQVLKQASAKWPENTLRHATDLLALSISLAKSPPLELASLKDNLQKKELWLETLKAQKTVKGRFEREMTTAQTEMQALKKQIQTMEDNAEQHTEAVPLKDKHIRQAMAVLTGERIGVIGEDELTKLSNAKKILSEYIKGQPEALTTIEEGLSEIVVRQKTGGVPNRPITSLLLCGPTGVGKTEVLKVIAKEFMNNNFMRLDMSEYKEAHQVSKLLGSPPGYVGHENGGLIDQIRNNPNSVIVFDELEKAHEDIFDVLLPILEEGEMRDNQGKFVSFRNSIVAMTTNLNNEQITDLIMKHRQQKAKGGAAASKDPALAMGELETQMKDLLTKKPGGKGVGLRPELLGRIEYVVPFNPLTKRNVLEILDIRLKEMNQESFLKDNNLEVTLSDAAKARLVDLTGASSLPAKPKAGAGVANNQANATGTGARGGRKKPEANPEETPLQGGARDVRNNFNRFVNKKVFRDLTFDPKLKDLENAKLIVDYDSASQTFTVKAQPLKKVGIASGQAKGRTLAFA